MGTNVGLVKWDVHNNIFQTFDYEQNLYSLDINDLAFDKEQNLWLATNTGLVKYDGNNFIYFNHKTVSDLPDAPFTKIIFDSSNTLYAALGSYGDFFKGRYEFGGLVIFKEGNWKVFYGSDYDFSWNITDMIIYHNKLLICLPRQTPFFETNFFTIVNDELQIIPDLDLKMYVSNLTIDSQDSLWAVSGRYLYKLRNNKWITIIDGDKEHIGSIFRRGWADQEGGIYLSGYEYLLYFNINDNQNGINYGNGLPDGMKLIRHAKEEFSDMVAINREYYFVSLDGLKKIKQKVLKSYKIPKNLDQNKIFGLGLSPWNEILVSTGISTQLFNGQSWKRIGAIDSGYGTYNRDFRYSKDKRLFTNHDPLYKIGHNSGYVTGLDFDNYGNLWTAYTLLYINFSTGMKHQISYDEIGIKVPPNHFTPQFRDVIVDKFNHVWYCGWYGYIVMYDGQIWHIYDAEDVGTPGLNLDNAFSDSKGRVWFTDNQTSPNWGIIMYEKSKWATISFPDLPRGEYIYQIAEDHFGNLWFASEAGLLQYDNQYWYLYNYQTTPMDIKGTTAVIIDRRGNIWIGTNHGLYIYNPYSIDFTSDIWQSPVTSLTLSSVKQTPKVIFKPNRNINIVKYDLQRARNNYKFWTINSISATDSSSELSIQDTTLILGEYYYRIKGVDDHGRAYYSNALIFNGHYTVSVTNFNIFIKENKYFFEWDAINEKFVVSYLILQSKKDDAQFHPIFRVKSMKSQEKNHYEICGGKIEKDAPIYRYKLVAILTDSTQYTASEKTFSPSFPKTLEISKNYPNPFNSDTKIDLKVPDKGMIKIDIFNLLGQHIKKILHNEFEAGFYTIKINLRNEPSGIYFCRVNFKNKNKYIKMVLTK